MRTDKSVTPGIRINDNTHMKMTAHHDKKREKRTTKLMLPDKDIAIQTSLSNCTISG
jgi:hypothetical protein